MQPAETNDVPTPTTTATPAPEAMSQDNPAAVTPPPRSKWIVKDFSSVKPMTSLVDGYNRIAICEHILWKHWNGI